MSTGTSAETSAAMDTEMAARIDQYRVVQWATGAMGKAVLRGVIDSPDTTVAGAYMYYADKVGRDVGALARRDDQGVNSTASQADILATPADVVVHAGRLGLPGAHDDEIVALLESGKNVLSINGYTCPDAWEPDRRARLQAAALKGKATLAGVGLNPGFVSERLAAVAADACSRLDHVDIEESADSSQVQAPDYLFGTLGIGSDPAALDPNDEQWAPAAVMNGLYEESLAALAESLGLCDYQVDTDHAVFATSAALDLPAGRVGAGTVSHLRWRWRAVADGAPRITLTVHWYVSDEHLDQPDPPLWRLRLTGQPDLTMDVGLAKNAHDASRMSAEQYALAGAVLSAIPRVVAAPPGLLGPTRPDRTLFPFERTDHDT